MIIPVMPSPVSDHAFDPELRCGLIDPVSGARCTRRVHEDARHSDMSHWSINLSWTHFPPLGLLKPNEKSTGEEIESAELLP